MKIIDSGAEDQQRAHGAQGKEFDVVVANPPYGIPWKGYEKEIRNDQTGQFSFLPTVSDGQLLFLQHNAWHLHENKGIVVEVNNGSVQR